MGFAGVLQGIAGSFCRVLQGIAGSFAGCLQGGFAGVLQGLCRVSRGEGRERGSSSKREDRKRSRPPAPKGLVGLLRNGAVV